MSVDPGSRGWNEHRHRFDPASVRSEALAPGAALANLIAGSVVNAWSQAVAPTGSTTSATAVAMPSTLGSGLSLTGYLGGRLLILGKIGVYYTVALGQPRISLYLNGADQNIRAVAPQPASLGSSNVELQMLAFLSSLATSPTPLVQMYYDTTAGTLNSQTAVYSWVVALELVR